MNEELDNYAELSQKKVNVCEFHIRKFVVLTLAMYNNTLTISYVQITVKHVVNTGSEHSYTFDEEFVQVKIQML
jgi:hypothetical protein